MRSTFGITLLLLGLALPCAAQDVLRVRVLDRATREPVATALVRVSGSPTTALTDGAGTARVSVTRPEVELVIERTGYTTVKQRARLERSAEIVIELEPAPTALDALVVTASRRLQRLKDAPVATELVTRREIEESGAADLAGVLLERTGIELEGGHPAGSGAMLQGLGVERVLVLLDGQPLPGRIAGNFDLSRIPSGMLERVEVVKGPQSTLFGSEAMGGVINLITRRPSGAWAGEAQVLSGSQNRLDASTRVQGKLGPVALLLDGGGRRIELAPGQAESEGALSERWDGLLKGSWQKKTLDLEATALLIDERQRWQSGQLFNFADNRQLAGRLSAGWRVGDHHFAPTLFLSQFQHLARRANRPEPLPGGEQETQEIAEAELLYSLRHGPRTLDAGVELRREAITSARVVERERSLDAAEAFAQLTLPLGFIDVVPGVRFTATDAWGSHVTPRVAFLLRASESLTVRASAGTGFRAPAFKELYMHFANIAPGVSYVVRGNPGLQPETSSNVSVSAELARGAWYLRAQGFHNRFDDFIETQAAGDSAGLTLFSYGNIQNGVTRGGELELGTTRGAIHAELGYSYLQARDDATGAALLGRPEHAARAMLGYTTRFGSRLTFTAVHTGKTPLARTDSGPHERDPFTRIDLRMAQTVLNRVDVSVGVENLFEERPTGWPGFSGRQGYVGLRWRLGGGE
jgi:outer membrane receptor for ferrienterochelin and colicins